LSLDLVRHIPLDQLVVGKNNVRRKDLDKGIDDLAVSIKSNGLLEPIITYFDSESEKFVILAGQRRFHAHNNLNEQYPGQNFDKIKCLVVDKPKTQEQEKAISLAESITQLPLQTIDLRKAVTDLYEKYYDYDIVMDKFGLSKYLVDKYVRLARLPQEIKSAINDGAIHPTTKTAENAALKAVEAFDYTKDSDVSIEQVIELARAWTKSGPTKDSLLNEAKKGGTVKEMSERAKRKPRTKLQIDLSQEIADKLAEVASSKDEKETERAASYIVDGVNRDYSELRD